MLNVIVPQSYGSVEMTVIRLPGKTSKRKSDEAPVPQTDTGSQGEDPKVLE